nr:MAG TPA: hypothetical protein [Caudoviricetes sp.]
MENSCIRSNNSIYRDEINLGVYPTGYTPLFCFYTTFYTAFVYILLTI